MAEGRVYLSKRSEGGSTTLEIYAYDFAGEIQWIKNITTTADYEPFSLVVSEDENTIVVIGNGSTSIYTLAYDVLYTHDTGGVNLELMYANGKYLVRSFVALYRADLWDSADGITWNLVTPIDYASAYCVYYNILYSSEYGLYYEQHIDSYEVTYGILSYDTDYNFYTGSTTFPFYEYNPDGHLFHEGKIYGGKGTYSTYGFYRTEGTSVATLSTSESIACRQDTCIYINTSGDICALATDTATNNRYEWVLIGDTFTKGNLVQTGVTVYEGIWRSFSVPTSNGYGYLEFSNHVSKWDLPDTTYFVSPYGSADLTQPAGSTYLWSAFYVIPGTYPTAEPDFWTERVKCTELYYDYYQRATSAVFDSEGVQLADNITLLVYEAIANDVITAQTADAINYIGILQVADVVSPQTVTGF